MAVDLAAAATVQSMGGQHHHHHHFHLPHLHLHLHHGSHNQSQSQNDCKEWYKQVPKGCVAVDVGIEGEEKQQRFVVPVEYVNHPLFSQLLKQAEEEYAFQYEHGRITLPCAVAYFRQVHDQIQHDHLLRRHQHRCFP